MGATKQRKDMKGIEKPRNSQPLEEAALSDEDSQIILTPNGLPDDAVELEPDKTTRYIWVEGHFRCKVIIRRKFKDPRGNYYFVNLSEKYKNPMGREEVTESVIALGDNVHRIISYLRDEMSEVCEQEIMKTNYWMLDETPGLVGVTDKEGNKRYLNRYFWGIKAKLMKVCWFIYEHGSRGLKAIKTFLDNFIGFFTSDGYVVYSLYQDPKNQLLPCYIRL